MAENNPADRSSKHSQANDREAALLHFLLENIPDRIYFKDTDSRFIRVSRAKAQRHGISDPAQLIGKTDLDLFTAEHAREAMADEQQILRTGEAIVGKVEKETLPDDTVQWALTTKMPLRDARGEIIGTCGISKDVTAQKQLEEALAASNHELAEANRNLKAMQQQLLEAEKLQAVGRLAYGVAHEVRNPLNIVQMGLEFLAGISTTPDGPIPPEVIHEMKSAISRADAVISTLMETTSPSAMNLVSCDVRSVLGEVLETLAKGAASRGIDIRTEFQADLPPIQADRAKIQHVFHGIITNAIEAMGAGGKLCVRASLQEASPPEAERDAGDRTAARLVTGSSAVLVEIEDTGTGIPPEAIGKVFDPFFTTKETGQGTGTGLGLTVCRKLVELHRGTIQIENRTDRSGARVAVLFPLPT